MISAENLTVARSGRTIVKGITFSVAPGGLHVVIGSNGSGKSTLLAALAGDLKPVGGQIYLGSRSLKALSDHEQAQQRAVLSQHATLFPYSVSDFLQLVHAQRERLGLATPSTGIDVSELANRKLTSLSGGERARVMLAATLAQGAKVLLLDEPTAAFDRHYRDRFINWLQDWRELDYTIVLVTHDEKIERIADTRSDLE